MNILQISKSSRVLILLAGWFLVAFFSADAWGQVTYNWIGGAGVQDWGTATNWNPNGIPGANDTAQIFESDAVNRTVSYLNTFAVAPTLAELNINATGTGTLTFALGQAGNPGTLVVENVGFSQALVNQTNGAFTVTGYLNVGYDTGTTCTYTMDGGTLDPTYMYVGEHGTGIFNQSQNLGIPTTVTAVALALGDDTGSNGTYTLSGGTLNTTYSYIGNIGPGAFTQSGGSHTSSSYFGVGVNAGVTGTYNLDGGALNTFSSAVGDYGIGIFNQTDGSHTVTNEFSVGVYAGSNGTYNLSGGTLTADAAYIGDNGTGAFTQSETSGPSTVTVTYMGIGRGAGGNGTYLLNGGTLTINENLWVGALGTGTFTQAGGTFTATGNTNITLGEGDTGIGTYNLQVGTLSVQYLNVGDHGIGTFNQSPGTTLELAGDIMVNSQVGTSVFNQLGGTTTVTGHLGVGRDVNSHAEYNLQDGTLNTGNLYVGYEGTGTFDQTGGSHTVTENIYLADFGANGNATYNLQGGTLTANNPGYGELNVGNQGIATFNQSAGTTLTVNWLAVNSQAGTSEFNQAGGTTTVANDLGVGVDSGSRGAYTLQGGSLAVAGDEAVGIEGTGTFTQTGGTHTVGGDLAVGFEAGSTGTFNLSGAGSLAVAGSEVVGHSGTGAFTQTGGAHTVGVDLAVGFAAQGAGTFDLQGGSLAVAGNEAVGNNGTGTGTCTGTFTQSGGSHTVGGDMVVGYHAGGTGSYTQSGGAITVTGNLYVGQESGSGTYHLNELSSPAQLSANYLGLGFNGGTGAFTQDAGTVTVTTWLTLGADGGGSGTYTLNGGSVTANFEDIGWSSTGIFNQNGGSNTLNQSFNLGWEATGVGIYTMTDGTLTSLGSNVLIGYAGQGTFTQSGGTHTVAMDLYLGHEATGIGTYNLSGTGTLVVTGSEGVGFSGTGEFVQSGGSHTVNGIGLGLGVTANSVGTFTLSGGTLVVAADMGVGVFGTGTFNQTGGSITIGNSLTLAFDAASHGTYNLSAGTITAPTINLNAGGVFTQTGGTLNFTTFNQTGGELTTTNIIVGNTGAGTFTQSGGSHTVTGSLTLAATPASPGTYNLQAGTLTASNIDVNTGGLFNFTGGTLNFTTLNLPGGTFQGDLDTVATVTGSGTIQGNYTNRGTVNPGNSPGTLNVVGSYTQAATGNYVLEIASAASYDQIAVTGTATINNGAILTPTLLGGYVPARNQVFADIITATGGITGTFTIDSPLQWRLLADNNSIDLIFGGGYRNFADPSLGLTHNQLQVGAMLETIAGAGTATGDLATILETLTDLPDSQVGGAYQQISPDKAAVLPAVSLAGATMQWRSIANRLTFRRWSGETGGSSLGRPGGSLSLSGSRLAGLMLAYNGASLGTLLRDQDKPREVNRPWAIYTDFVSTLGSQKTTANQTGYEFNIYGFNCGVDYRFRDDLMLGVGTGFYNTSASFNNSGGSGSANSIPFYLYGAYYPGAFYIMGSLGYTLNMYDLDRQISFGSINRTAQSSVDGSQLNVFGEAGYDFTIQRVIFTPAVSLAYSQVWVGGFNENGAGSLNLNVDAQSADSLQSGVGARLSLPFKTGDTRVLPQLSAFYQHEFSNNSRGLDARLSQTGSSFTFRTDSPGRDFALLGAGVALVLHQNLYLQANYNAEVGRTNYVAHNVYGGVRWEF